MTPRQWFIQQPRREQVIYLMIIANIVVMVLVIVITFVISKAMGWL